MTIPAFALPVRVELDAQAYVLILDANGNDICRVWERTDAEAIVAALNANVHAADCLEALNRGPCTCGCTPPETMRAMVDSAVAAERERCALIAENLRVREAFEPFDQGWSAAASEIAGDIRARTTTESTP